MKPPLPHTLEVWLLLAIVASPLIADPRAAIVLGILAVGWFLLRPLRREALVAGIGLSVALLSLILGGVQVPRLWQGLPGETGGLTSEAPLKARYQALWGSLIEEARMARRELEGRVYGGELSAEARLAAFRKLDERVESGTVGRGALFLLNPDGRARAWAGEGLLHDLETERIPREGIDFRASFGAVTLMAILPLEEAPRPWRVMAARSLSTDHLPFPPSGHPELLRRGWSLVDEASEAGEGSVVVAVEGLPTLVIQPVDGERVRVPAQRLSHRIAWLAIAFSLLAVAVLRGVGQALPVPEALSDRPVHTGWDVIALGLGGSLALGLGAGVEAPALAALLTGLLVAALGLRAGRKSKVGETVLPGPPFPGEAPIRWLSAGPLGGAVVALLGLGSWALQVWQGQVDLADGLLADARLTSFRFALFAAAFGLLALVGSRGATARPLQDRWCWAAVGLLVAGGSLHDAPLAGIPLLVAGGAVVGAWIQGRDWLRRPTTLAALICLAALASAGAWETVYRVKLRHDLGAEVLHRMAPPSPEEISRLAEDLKVFFDGRDLATTVPRNPDGLQVQDLAFTLWRRSPLARNDALSALVVETRNTPPSSFSFGLPLDDEGDLDEGEDRWGEIDLPVWRERRVEGEAELLYGGRVWGRARYWLLLQPGFRLRGNRRLEEIEAGLLSGRPGPSGAVDGLPPPALFALYSADGKVLRSPWDEVPPLPAQLRAGQVAKVATPAGRAWGFPRRGTEGWAVLYLPALGALKALERVATHAVGVLLVVALILFLLILLALPRPGFRELLWRTFRSYSKRLIIVTSGLLLVPLVLVNVLLVAGAEKRFEREQRSAGEAALDSLERLLAEFVRGLPPGISLQTQLTDEYLTRLSRIVRHEVNLYWQSEIFVSSKAELFTARLLPKRIPGEIYSRLLLLGYDLASRTNRVGDTTYLELYSPVRLAGEPVSENQLILSMPLLAQQKEVARELAALRRQALLVTVALFALLIAVGLRLAESFTTPLMELVEGTRRIAGGAASLDLAPSELELAALVNAIDEMAHRIAEGRQKLLREKQVVERMVENITSAVVSLDHDRRVLMRNRVAANLLGVEVGEPLERSGHPEPVAAFLAGVDKEVRQRTVRLTGGGGEEREWNLVWVPVPGSGEPAALLVVEDATEVLRGQRLEAWAEMARIIAHEIKNPLTPIRLNAEHIREVYSCNREHFEQVFDRCIRNILGQVEELQKIASEFSTYSSILHIERREGDVAEAMEELLEPYRAAPPPGVEVSFEADPPVIRARFDRRLLGRAVRNLLENALRATGEGGRVALRVMADSAEVRISVRDTGPGVSIPLLGRIFDPYFSTHDMGTGLGLPIARRIAEAHGGSISAHNLTQGGLEVTITMPLG